MVKGPTVSRRHFLALLPMPLLSAVLRLPVLRRLTDGDHPTPRPGIDASRVVKAADLHLPEAAPVFDLVREIPQVADGIRCHCGCAELPGYYSLLSCYEGAAMAQHCEICQGEARLVSRLHRDGWSLNGIRAAVDAAYADVAPSGSC